MLNNTTGSTVASAIVVLQKGGIGSGRSTPQEANPAYALATLVDGGGNFSINAPCGKSAVHVFAPSFLTTAVDTFAGRQLSLGIVQNANAVASPAVQISDLAASSNPLRGGAEVTFTANVQLRPGSAEKLTERVLLVNVTLGRAVALRPPAAATDAGYPSGVWSAQLRAPGSPGIYRFALLASTDAGSTAVTSVDLNVQR